MIATASFDKAGNDATLIAAYVIVDGGLGPIISMTDVLHLVSRHCDAEKDDDAHAVIELLHARPPSLSQGAARNLSTVLGNLAYAPLTPVEDRFRHDQSIQPRVGRRSTRWLVRRICQRPVGRLDSRLHRRRHGRCRVQTPRYRRCPGSWRSRRGTGRGLRVSSRGIRWGFCAVLHRRVRVQADTRWPDGTELARKRCLLGRFSFDSGCGLSA